MNMSTIRANLKRRLALAAFCVCVFSPLSVHAVTISYGDFSGDNVMYLDVTESNSLPNGVFAVNGPMISGDTLLLDPLQFSSQSMNVESHLIDSTLSTTVMAANNGSIDSITINELGDYSLGGVVGGQAQAEVGAAFFWTVLEVDNVAVSLATQATNLIVNTGSGPNGGIYTRPGDDGTAIIWSGTAAIDVNSFLASQQINGHATKVLLTFDNTLQTSAGAGSNAFIKKKSIGITVDGKIPEPTSILLLSLASAALPCCRRR